jgi:hypothetical protein
VASLKALGAFDAVLVTEMQTPQAAVDALDGKVAADRILVPPLLRVMRKTDPDTLADTAEAKR